jgi:hypothetical protein
LIKRRSVSVMVEMARAARRTGQPKIHYGAIRGTNFFRNIRRAVAPLPRAR